MGYFLQILMILIVIVLIDFLILENSCKVDGGYTGVRDVYQVRQMDRQVMG